MPYTKPTLTNIQHFKWLRRDFALTHDFGRILVPIAQAIQRKDRGDKKLLIGTHQSIMSALRVILGNLYRFHQIDPDLMCAIPRRNGSYPKSAFNPIGLSDRTMQRVLDYLEKSDPPFVEKHGGNRIHADRARDFASRYRPAPRLIEEIEVFIETHEATSQQDGQRNRGVSRGTTENTFGVAPPEDPTSPKWQAYFDRAPMPLIRMKDEEKKLSELPKNGETTGMAKRLAKYNEFLSDHWIDLLIPDTDFRALSNGGCPDALENEADFGDKDEKNGNGFDILYDNRLYRVFNNGRVDHGGRFYGGWWQQIKSEFRHYITINWYTTAEVDFSNMQAAMLYAMEGLDLPEDAYSLVGVPAEYRKLLKRTFFKLINATGQVRAPRKEELPEGWSWKEIQDALARKHEPISKHFKTGIGIELQRQDSDIAEAIMMRMMAKGRLVLPVHDSFIIKDADFGDELKEVMREEYRRATGHDIGAKVEETWAQKKPKIEPEIPGYHVRGAEDDIGDLEGRPEYASYKHRKFDFLKRKPEGWGHEHGFLL